METTNPNSTNTEIFEQICSLIAPSNKDNIELTRNTGFATDLSLDSLAVMDLLATIEDHFDITIPINVLPDLETVGQISDAVGEILQGGVM